MIGENSSGDEKAGSENVEVYLRATPGKAHERVVVLIGCGLAAARHSGKAQSRSCSVLPEGEHDMDKADAGLVTLDNFLDLRCRRIADEGSNRLRLRTQQQIECDDVRDHQHGRIDNRGNVHGAPNVPAALFT